MMLQILLSNGSLPWKGPQTTKLPLYLLLGLGQYFFQSAVLGLEPGLDASADAGQPIFGHFVLG